jgi:catechol 2,3-dioxygenase-like lactoylglutathione lyase family enzyme
MDRLGYVILFTGDIAGMRRFYEDGIGLTAREHSAEWVEFDTAGATLALAAMADPARRGVELRFLTGDIEARVAELSSRGAAFDPPGVDYDQSRSTPWTVSVSRWTRWLSLLR